MVGTIDNGVVGTTGRVIIVGSGVGGSCGVVRDATLFWVRYEYGI